MIYVHLITKPSERNKLSTKNNPLPQYQYNYQPHKSQTGGSVNAIGSGLPEELVLAEAEWKEKMCAMLNIWDDCSSEEEEESRSVKIEIEKSITVQVGEVLKAKMSSGTEWSQKIPEFEDFLRIGDEASRMVHEQKAKARILQSILAAEDAEEAERKVMKMTEQKRREKKLPQKQRKLQMLTK
ncbi:hypothetical protein JCGZ_15565 [Jatropha curcas]|uniref:Uncharacterized protein n=1 Tax=Jatropha curcas TaxID=180498 RepID=A0A067K3R8_JATCU|nr:hypothetical protein JCGZ_15565 [Jatropha curcas]